MTHRWSCSALWGWRSGVERGSENQAGSTSVLQTRPSWVGRWSSAYPWKYRPCSQHILLPEEIGQDDVTIVLSGTAIELYTRYSTSSATSVILTFEIWCAWGCMVTNLGYNSFYRCLSHTNWGINCGPYVQMSHKVSQTPLVRFWQNCESHACHCSFPAFSKVQW